MAEVTAGVDESLDSVLKRFNKKVQQQGILSELRRGEHYEKPSIKRKRQKAAKRRNSARSTSAANRAARR